MRTSRGNGALHSRLHETSVSGRGGSAAPLRYADPSELMKRDMLGKSGKAPEGKAEGKAEPKK